MKKAINIMTINIVILALKNTFSFENESASLPPRGPNIGNIMVGIEVIMPTIRVELVSSRTYQLTTVPLATNTEKAKPLAIR